MQHYWTHSTDHTFVATLVSSLLVPSLRHLLFLTFLLALYQISFSFPSGVLLEDGDPQIFSA